MQLINLRGRYTGAQIRRALEALGSDPNLDDTVFMKDMAFTIPGMPQYSGGVGLWSRLHVYQCVVFFPLDRPERPISSGSHYTQLSVTICTWAGKSAVRPTNQDHQLLSVTAHVLLSTLQRG